MTRIRKGFFLEKEGRVIGMATVHGDGLLYFYIQDVIIDPDFQHGGLGTLLMDKVMKYIRSQAVDKAYVALLSAKGLKPFYTRYGFIARFNERFGAGMFFIKGLIEA